MNKLAQKAKAIAALVGATATALLGVYGPDTQVGHILTIVVGVATAVATFAIPNAPAGTN